MPLELIKVKIITGLNQLDFNKRNYICWSKSTLDKFLYAGMREYVLSEVTKPKAGDSDLLNLDKEQPYTSRYLHEHSTHRV